MPNPVYTLSLSLSLTHAHEAVTSIAIQHYSLVCTQLNGSKYCYELLTIQLEISHLFKKKKGFKMELAENYVNDCTSTLTIILMRFALKENATSRIIGKCYFHF